MAYVRINTDWIWTTNVTPNEQNRVPEIQTESITSEISITKASDGDIKDDSFLNVSLEDIRKQKPGTRIRVQGVVSATPGLFGERLFYIADPGIQIYKSDAVFPDLELGDLVEITGTLRSNRGESRITVGRTDSITILDQEEVPQPHEVSDIGEETEGWLTQIKGIILEKKSGIFSVDTNGTTIEIRIKKGTEIKLDHLNQGIDVVITGIVSQTDDHYFLLPRFEEDMEIIEQIKEMSITPAYISGKEIASGEGQKKAYLLGGGTLVTLGGFGIRYFFQKKTGIHV